MKKLFLITLLISNTCIYAQFTYAVSPLNPGNRWVYLLTAAFHNEINIYEVLETSSVINGITCYAVLNGGHMGIFNNEYFARYDLAVSDSFYFYFKLNPELGANWFQYWYNEVRLKNSVIDTFRTSVFGNSIKVYEIDRRDSTGFFGSREYWTQEFGRIAGRYEQAEDILLGCVINGVLYGDTTTTIINDYEKQPNEFVLYQNYPNPFNTTTKIPFKIPEGAKVNIKIFDILGKEIIELLDEFKTEGFYEMVFDASELKSGIYFYSIATNKYFLTKKLLVLK